MSRTRTRTLSGGQRIMLGVGGVLAFALIGWGVLTLIGLFGQTTYQRDLTLTPTAGRLRIDVPGSLTIRAGTGSEVRVTEKMRYGFRKPKVTEEATADGLVIRARCPWYNSNCSVDVDLTVPASLSVDARSSGGDISATGLTGSVQLDSSGGGITASGLTGSVVLHSSGGDIMASELAGSARMDSSGGGVQATGLRSLQVDARSSGGDVTLTFASAPDRVTADSSGGGVRIGLPDGEAYHVDADSSGGDTRTEVATDPRSPRLIDAHSSGGDVLLETTSEG